MRELLPDPRDDVDLRAAYAVPAGRHVRVNFASSVDGAVAVDGRSRALSSDADRKLFQLLRRMADVVLVGAGTVRAENYGPALEDDGHVLPIAVVTRSLDLDPAARLFSGDGVRPIVVTCGGAPADRLERLSAVADLLVIGEDNVDLAAVLDVLAERGLEKVLCEGGPHLFGSLVAADRFDELCLTLAPLVVGGRSGRIVAGLDGIVVDGLHLRHVLADGEHLFLRYSTIGTS